MAWFQTLAALLYRAARETGDIDPDAVTEILNVTEEEATAETVSGESPVWGVMYFVNHFRMCQWNSVADPGFPRENP